MRHVVSLSGGTTSWAAGKRVVERFGSEDVVLLFADVRGEDDETYAFLEEGAANIGVPVTRIEDGRGVWQVFHEEGMIGNTRADLCSRILKRELIERWLGETGDPSTTRMYLGMDSSEGDRIETTRERWRPWVVDYPLMWEPDLWKPACIAWARAEGLTPPPLTELGFPHSNCAGACVKAGQKQWARLLRLRPEVYAEWERQEERFRREKGKDVAILRDRRGGPTKPLPLRVFRERLEANPQLALFDEGEACSCMG